MGAEKPNQAFQTEQGISECYLEGCLKHSGSISGFIYVFTQLVKASQGDGRLVLADVDEALARLLGELGAAANRRGVALRVPLRGMKSNVGDYNKPQGDSHNPQHDKRTQGDGDSLDMMNRLFWLSNENEILRVPLRGMKSNVGGYHKPQDDSWKSQDDDNLPMQDDSARVPPPVEEVIAQAAESLADPNFFIAEISGIISALVELKSVTSQKKT